MSPLQGFLRINLTVYLLDLLGDAGMSAVGTTLFHSPGWNEGKARNGTLGTHRQNRVSSVGAALTGKKYCQARQDDYICVIQSIIQYGTIHFSTLCAFSISHSI